MQSITTRCIVKGCRYKECHVSKGHQCGTCNKFGHGQLECSNVELMNKLLAHPKYNDILPEYKQCTRSKCKYKEYHQTHGHMCKLCNNKHSKYNCMHNAEFIQRQTNKLNNIAGHKYSIICPKCRQKNHINDDNFTSDKIHTCIICLSDNVESVFLPTCRHSNICKECCCKIAIYPTDVENGMNASFNSLNNAANAIFMQTPDKIYCHLYAGMGCYWLARRNNTNYLCEFMFCHSDSHYSADYTDILLYQNNFINTYKQITINL